MKYEEKDGKVVIFLDGRLDTDSAPVWEEEIIKFTESKTDAQIIFDARDLEYISSSGLRVLMQVCKKVNSAPEIINVSNDVYDIFDVTGFTQLYTVKKA